MMDTKVLVHCKMGISRSAATVSNLCTPCANYSTRMYMYTCTCVYTHVLCAHTMYIYMYMYVYHVVKSMPV